jgi:PAS domain S-box-containing protein
VNDPKNISGGKPRLLFVDDEATLREHLARTLSDEYEVDTAANGDEALRRVLQTRPDVIVSDIVMPELGGIELLRTLRNTPSTQTIPVLLISGRAPEALRLQGFDEGADGYLPKPYTERELRTRIRAMLGIGRIRRAELRTQVLEQAAQQAMAERAALLEAITDPFYALDRSWRLTYANQRALDYFRVSRQEMLGRNIWEMIPEGKGTIFQTSLEQAVREKTSVDFEAFSPFSKRWVAIFAYPTDQGLAITFRDISERKQTEDALRNAEERYRAFVANSSEGIWRYELDVPLDLALPSDAQIEHLYRYACLAELNDVMARMYGYERASDLVGARVVQMLPREDEAARRYLREVVEARFAFADRESAERDRHGELRYFANSMVPVIENGKLLRVWGTQRDVTERKRAEQAMRESEERYRLLFSSIDEGFCILEVLFDDEGRPADYIFVEVNDAFERQTGLVDAVGRRMRDLAPRHELHWFEVYGRIAKTGVAERFEHEAAPLGFWYDVYAFRVGPPELRRVGVLFNDITARKRSEARLLESDRRKDEFLATLAHELRNPLAPLRTGLQIARLTSKADSPLHRTIEMMERQLSHLVHLVDDLLDVARVSSGKIALRKGQVALSDVLTQSIDGAQAMIDTRDQQLYIDKTTEELIVDGDFDRLAQVFSNLLSNAAKYTPIGGRIRVIVARGKNEAVVQIVDSGIGIPAEHLEDVFDLFSQVRAHHGHADGGLGIGLSLVKTLVSLHGGSVSAYSAGEGEGSTFTVRLPLSAVDQSSAQEPPVPQKREGDFARRRVLVADDNVDAATSLALLLQIEGHEVAVVYDGAEAVDQVPHFRPDLVILDIGMPKMDGLEAARRIRATSEGKNLVLVAVTGWGQPADRERTRAAGFDAHLVKPVEGGALQALLDRLVRSP